MKTTAARAWFAVGMLTTCYVVSLLDRLVVSLLVEPMKRDLALSDVQVALIQGPAFALFYATMSLPLGRFADLVNRRNLIAGAMLFWSVCTGACGLAAGFAALFAARIGVGAGEAALTPAAYSMLADLFRREQLGRALAVYTIGGVAGNGIALVMGGAIYGYFETHGAPALPILRALAPWQLTFISVSVPGIVLALLIPIMLGEPDREAGSERPRIAATLRHVWSERRMYVPAFAAYASLCALIYAFTSWMPSFLIRQFALNPAQAGTAFGTIMLTAGVAGPLIAGWAADRRLPVRGVMAPLEVMRAFFFIVAAVAPFAFTASNLSFALVGCSVVAFGSTGLLGLVPLLIQITAPNRMRGQISGLNLMLGNMLGFGTGPVLVAVLAEHAFTTAGLALALAAALPGFAVLGIAAVGIGSHARSGVRNAAG